MVPTPELQKAMLSSHYATPFTSIRSAPSYCNNYQIYPDKTGSPRASFIARNRWSHRLRRKEIPVRALL